MNRRNFFEMITGAVASLVVAPFFKLEDLYDPVSIFTHDGADTNYGFIGSWEQILLDLMFENIAPTPEFELGTLNISLHTGTD